MKKLIVSTLALSTLLWIGCGGDDDNGGGGGGGDNTVTVTADTMIAPAMPLVYNDAAWDDVTATSISLSTGNPLPVGPVKTPMGPDKSLNAPSSVDLQAIKKGDRLYLRFQWADASLSMQREQWKLTDSDFNFTPQIQHGEDQVIALFEDHPDSAWDLWNWRVLTTGTQNKAEDGTMLNGDTVWDAGPNRVAVKNDNNVAFTPQFFPSSEWQFTGDVFYKSEKIPRSQAVQGMRNWTIGQTIPGWWIDDEVNWATVTESRWDIRTVHFYNENAGQYTLVMVRDLTTGNDDDVDMATLDRIKTRIGILDDDTEIATGSTQRKFSEDFWLALP